MKKNLLPVLTIALLLFTTTACSQMTKVAASKDYMKQNINVGNFNGIKLMGSADIVYNQSTGKPSVQVYGPHNMVELLEIRVENETLIVQFKKNTNIQNNGKLEIKVSSPQLNSMNIYGSGDVTFVNGIKSDKDIDIAIYGSGDIDGSRINCRQLSTAISGSGDIKLNDIKSTEIKVRVSGSGDVTLTGNSQKAEYSVSGSGSITASMLKASIVSAHVSGSGDIECYATEQLTGSVSGSGKVAYKGDPKIDFSRKGLHKL